MQKLEAVQVERSARMRSAFPGYYSTELFLFFTLIRAKLQSQILSIRTLASSLVHPIPLSSALDRLGWVESNDYYLPGYLQEPAVQELPCEMVCS